ARARPAREAARRSVARGSRPPRGPRALGREPRAGDDRRRPRGGHRGRNRGPLARGLRRAPGNPGAVRWLFRLRPEEAVALAFLLPTTYLTVAANVYARQGGGLGGRPP